MQDGMTDESFARYDTACRYLRGKVSRSSAFTAALLCFQLLATTSSLAADSSSSAFANKLLLSDSYQPGQAIKLHDYSSHGDNKSSAASSVPPPSPTSGNSSIDWHLPDSQPSLNVAPKSSGNDPIYFPSPEELTKMTSGGSNSDTGAGGNSSSSSSSSSISGSTSAASSTHKPKSGLKQKIKHFAGDFVTEVVAPGASGGGTGTGGSSVVNIIPGIPHAAGGGYGGGGGGGSEMAGEVQRGQQAEAAGNYYQAAQNYWYAVDLAVGGKGYKERADFWVTGNVCGIPPKELYRRALRCHVIMYRAYLDTGKTWGLEPSVCQGMGVALFKDLACLELCDPDNPAWYYLSALNAIGADDKELAHTRAFWDLGAAMDCKSCSPELRKKCEVLREHIRLAALLELADENRAKFENMEAQVFGIEHPHTVVYKDSSGGITHVITCAGGMYQYYYGFMKEMLKDDYPKFKANFARLQAYIASQPNNPVAIPPGDGAPEIVEFKQKQVEAKCYDKVVYRVGGHF